MKTATIPQSITAQRWETQAAEIEPEAAAMVLLETMFDLGAGAVLVTIGQDEIALDSDRADLSPLLQFLATGNTPTDDAFPLISVPMFDDCAAKAAFATLGRRAFIETGAGRGRVAFHVDWGRDAPKLQCCEPANPRAEGGRLAISILRGKVRVGRLQDAAKRKWSRKGLGCAVKVQRANLLERA